MTHYTPGSTKYTEKLTRNHKNLVNYIEFSKPLSYSYILTFIDLKLFPFFECSPQLRYKHSDTIQLRHSHIDREECVMPAISVWYPK